MTDPETITRLTAEQERQIEEALDAFRWLRGRLQEGGVPLAAIREAIRRLRDE